MKKGLLALAAGLFLTAGSVQAADYYLIGGFNGWSLKDSKCKFTPADNGEYVLDYQGTLTSGFKINDGTWSNNNANWGAGGTLTIGTVYNLNVGGSSGNINIAGGNIDNPHIVFNPTANTLLITGQEVQAEYTYAVHGSFVPSWESRNMTEEDGIWTLSANVTSALTFGIKKNDKSTGSQVEWISSANGATAVLNTAMPCQVEGTNWTLTEAGEFTFKFDPEAMTLTIVGEGVEVERTIYLAGEFNSWNGSDANYQFTKGDNNTYTLNMESLMGAFKVVSDGSWLGTTSPVVSGEEYVLTDIGMENMKLASAEATNITFTFDPETKTLKAVYDGGEIDYSGWYVNVIGDFNDWADNGINPDENNIATFENLPIGTSGFKVKVWNGTSDVWHSNGFAIALNSWVAIPDNSDANMTVEGATEASEYTVSFNCATNEIMIETAVGVEAIEAANGEAVYFNLQGVRVANPENGLFIRVQNGKAVKVVK